MRTKDGCLYVYDQMVTVQPLPVSPELKDYTYCQFESDLTAITADSLRGNNSLLWHLPDGSIDTLTTLPAPSTDVDGTFYRYVQQYNPITGCASPMDTATITIYKLPIAPFTQVVDVCEGSADTSSPIALASGILHWYESDSITAISGLPMITGASLSASKNYLVRQEDTNGCYSPFAVAPINLLEKPDIAIQAVGNKFNICDGEQISLSLSSTQGIAEISWNVKWIDASGNEQTYSPGLGSTGSTFVHRPDTSSTYTATVVTNDSCTYTYSKLVTVQSLPKVPNINDYEYCQFEPSIVITASNLENGNTLLWNRTNGVTDTLSMLPAPNTDSVGAYYRYVQQYNPVTGCVSEIDTSTIFIRSLPAPPLSKTYWICKDTSPDTLRIEQGNYSPSYLSQLTVEWFSSDAISYDTIPTVPTADTGSTTYLVRNRNTFGCTSQMVELYANVYQVTVDSINYHDVDCYNYKDAELQVHGHGPYPVSWRYID